MYDAIMEFELELLLMAGVCFGAAVLALVSVVSNNLVRKHRK